MEWPMRRGIRTRQVRICRAHGPAEPLAVTASGTSRRNVLGAIALVKRTMATSRSEATTTQTNPDNEATVREQDAPRPTNRGRPNLRPALPVRIHPRENDFRLTYSFRNGPARRRSLERNRGRRSSLQGCGSERGPPRDKVAHRAGIQAVAASTTAQLPARQTGT